MNILFIEADVYLDRDQEKFQKKLEAAGHDVHVVCNCYDKKQLFNLKIQLKSNIFDAIFVQTTFTYDKKFELIIPLCGLISHPVELWYSGHASAALFRNYIPQEHIDKFTFYDIWMDSYQSDDNEFIPWKKQVQL
jgi:hypothetical protein